jgi:hypothetical protein
MTNNGEQEGGKVNPGVMPRDKVMAMYGMKV